MAGIAIVTSTTLLSFYTSRGVSAGFIAVVQFAAGLMASVRVPRAFAAQRLRRERQIRPCRVPHGPGVRRRGRLRWRAD